MSTIVATASTSRAGATALRPTAPTLCLGIAREAASCALAGAAKTVAHGVLDGRTTVSATRSSSRTTCGPSAGGVVDCASDAESEEHFDLTDSPRAGSGAIINTMKRSFHILLTLFT